jgi:hypothetical protein
VFLLQSGALKESPQERCRFIRDADDFVGRLTVEFEVGSVSGRPSFQSEKRLSSLRPKRRLATAVRLTVMLTRGFCRATQAFFAFGLAEVTTPLAMRPGPVSFSLANTKIVSPLAMRLPPYIVFCALKPNVFADGSLTSALIANVMILMSHNESQDRLLD